MGFGQYSYDSPGRLTLDQIVPSWNAADARKAGHNRATYTYTPTGERRFRLIHTDVVTLSPRGEITLDTGGYNTKTTRAAFVQGLIALGVLATRADGYTDAAGKPVATTWDHATRRFVAPPGAEWARVLKPGLLPDNWTANAWGASRKGDRKLAFKIGPNSGYHGDAGSGGVCIRFRETLSFTLDGAEVIIQTVDGALFDRHQHLLAA